MERGKQSGLPSHLEHSPLSHRESPSHLKLETVLPPATPYPTNVLMYRNHTLKALKVKERSLSRLTIKKVNTDLKTKTGR